MSPTYRSLDDDDDDAACHFCHHDCGSVDLSFVIPVFNGAQTVANVVADIGSRCVAVAHEIILVDDGSSDTSREVCRMLARNNPGTVRVLELARNFGEHNAVMAGLHESCGRHVAVLDDDGQNPPGEALRMLAHARAREFDVVYARYRDYKHSIPRKFCSWLNDKTAAFFLNKPKHLYLSSFKVMNRFTVDEITRYSGPFPYIDALILNATQNIGQLDVEHRERLAGRSGYTFGKLAALWLNTLAGTLAPLRLLLVAGMFTAACGALALGGLAVATFLGAVPASSIPLLLAALTLFCGIQCAALGLLGETIGRVLLHQSGRAQFVVRQCVHGPAHAQISVEHPATLPHSISAKAG